jgi:hypothetical protein
MKLRCAFARLTKNGLAMLEHLQNQQCQITYFWELSGERRKFAQSVKIVQPSSDLSSGLPKLHCDESCTMGKSRKSALASVNGSPLSMHISDNPDDLLSGDSNKLAISSIVHVAKMTALPWPRYTANCESRR